MQLIVNPGAELPIYRQIMRQISDAIAGGRLRPGDRLSSQRELAEQLVISPLTVKKAYDELEREGLIRTQRGRGTFVAAAAAAAAADPAIQRERLREPARVLLTRALLAGVPFAELVALLEQVRDELAEERSSGGRVEKDERRGRPSGRPGGVSR